MTPRALAIAAAAVVMITATSTACSGSSGDDAGATGSSASVESTGATTTEPRVFSSDPFSPDAAYDDFPVGPLAALLGREPLAEDGVTRQAEQADAVARSVEDRARQDAVAECMRAAGFEYTVVEPSVPAAATAGERLSRREYAARYGFGIATTFEDSLAAAPDPAERGADADPNAAYIESLSPERREDYLAALYGAPPEPQPAPTALEPPSTTTPPDPGCATAVIEPPVTEDQFFVIDLENRMAAEIDAPAAADQRVIDATAAYAECMAGEGFAGIAGPDAATSAITQRMEPLYASLSTSFSASTSVPPVDRALLAEIKADEIAMATADLACGEELRRVAFTVRSEHEERFIEQHGPDLERYRALTSG